MGFGVTDTIPNKEEHIAYLFCAKRDGISCPFTVKIAGWTGLRAAKPFDKAKKEMRGARYPNSARMSC